MSKPARGSKRVCPSCGARFYDLSRTPIICPVMPGRLSGDTSPVRGAAERAAAGRAEKGRRAGGRGSNDRSREVISLEEVEEAGADVAAEEDEEIVDLGDDAPEIPAAGDDDTFLEEEEEGEADVSGIVGTPGEET